MRDPASGIPKSRDLSSGGALSAPRIVRARWVAFGAAWAAAGLPRVAAAADAPALLEPAGDTAEEAPAEEPPGAPTPQASPLVITGYVDVGFAKAQGNGTSWPADFMPPTVGAPADYYVDTFAPTVNSRGDVASTVPPQPPGLTSPNTTNGFLPRSAGIGGKPSFLLNTAS